MSEIVGFAFLAGLSIGLIGGFLFVAGAAATTEKKRIRNGFMESDGVLYRISMVEP